VAIDIPASQFHNNFRFFLFYLERIGFYMFLLIHRHTGTSTYYRFAVTVIASFALFSCKTAKLSDAVAKEELGEYFDAAQIYKKVYAKTPSKEKALKGSVAFHMAECFRVTNNTQRALTGYQNAIRFTYKDSLSSLYAAQMAHKSGRYSEAIKHYSAYLETDPHSTLAKNGIAGCDSALAWKNNPTPYTVKRMDAFNSRRSEFAPMLFGKEYDQLYFSSSRDAALGDSKSAITGMKNNDFFLVKKDDKGQWGAPEQLSDEVNTEFDEGACSFTRDGSTMYYTYCQEDEEYPRSAAIYKSSRAGAKWNKGQYLEIFKDTLTMAAHPAVSPDGEYLYFVSDAPGGQGGKDIWRMALTGSAANAIENLGPEINTPGDELFPYVRDSVTLYFASDGHPGMGGLDIFRATKQKNGKWRVENMGVPLNSAADDFGITFAGEEESGFFSSNRNDGRGSDHIYAFEHPTVKVRIEGWVLDRDEVEIPDAVIRIVGKDGTNQKIIARKDGTYVMEAERAMDYVMMASARGYLNQKKTLSIPATDSLFKATEKNRAYYVDFSLPSISKPVLIEHIFYDFDRATLRPESKAALDEMTAMLQDNPNVTIELAAHTDRKGSETYNESLSQRRAQSVVDYLIAGGIEADRLTPAGYGKSRPKAVTKKMHEQHGFLPEEQLLDEVFIESLTPEQQEIADQINRRTEFQVLRTTYKLY
jgi:peptidoglycan-associated lipoprotein